MNLPPVEWGVTKENTPKDKRMADEVVVVMKIRETGKERRASHIENH